jgi:hypothetical protein
MEDVGVIVRTKFRNKQRLFVPADLVVSGEKNSEVLE